MRDRPRAGLRFFTFEWRKLDISSIFLDRMMLHTVITYVFVHPVSFASRERLSSVATLPSSMGIKFQPGMWWSS